jgi:anti-sigma regulatory factor (Ser/Thr protein kinase)
MLYDSDEQYTERVAAYFEAGLDSGELLVAVPGPDTEPLLRTALGATSKRVSLHVGEDWYTRPEAAVAAYDATVRAALRDGAAGLRVVAELPICSSREEWDAWIRYEAVINVALAGRPVSVMCTCDSRVVPEHVVEGVCRTHPHVVSDSRRENAAYRDPEEVLRAIPPPPEPLPELHEIPVNADPRTLRRELSRELASAHVDADAADGMILAVNEVVANAVRHANGVSSLRVGAGERTFVCQISDAGNGFDDPLAGYVPPSAPAGNGGGLWVARQLTRRVDLAPSPFGGLTVTLWT